MRRTTIMRGDRFTVSSLGNGCAEHGSWGYIVEDHEARKSVWFQDEEATEFKRKLDAAEARWPMLTVDGTLGRVWWDEELDLIADDMPLLAA